MKDLPDNAPSSIVARADALMQRRRQASGMRPPEAEDLPVLTEVVHPDDDLPVLTVEIDEPSVDEPSPPASPEPVPADPAIDPAVLNILAHELASRLQERLADRLPGLIQEALQASLAGLASQLGEGLQELSESSIRDFLAEREKLAKIQQQR